MQPQAQITSVYPPNSGGRVRTSYLPLCRPAQPV